MKARHIAYLILLSGSWLTSSAHAETFHVAITGSDTNAGTEAAPFRTIEKARNTVRTIITGGQTEAIRVKIGTGTYVLSDTLTFDQRDSGTDTHAVIYEAADPDTPPSITGGQSIGGSWVNEGGDLWSIVIPEVASGDWWFRDLYRGEQRQTRSREPDFDMDAGFTIGDPEPAGDPDYPQYIRPVTDVNLLVVAELLAADRTSVRVTGPAFPEVFSSDNAELVTLGPWSTTRSLVSDAKDFQIQTYIRPGVEGLYWTELRIKRTLFLEHAKAFVDEPGEWFLEAATGKLYYYATSNPNGAPFWAPKIERLITVKGTASQPVKNIRFQHLLFQGAAWQMPDGEYRGTQAHFYRPDGLTYSRPAVEAIRFENAINPVVFGCTLLRTGATGIAMGRGCVDGRVEYCTFDDIGGTAISLGDNIGIEKLGDDTNKAIRLRAAHNKISRFGQIQFGAVGIWQAFCPDSVIEYNRIQNAPYSGISIGWDWTDAVTRQRGVSVNNNHVSDVLKLFDDGAGIYLVGRQDGTTIHHNRIHDVKNGNGLQFDQGTSFLTAEKNLIYRVGKHGVACNQGYERVVRNNLFVNAGESLINMRQVGNFSGETVMTFEHNIYQFSDSSDLIGRGGSETLFQMDTVFDHNLYDSTTGNPLLVDNNQSFASWQTAGGDVNSVTDVAPVFADPANDDYRLDNAAAIDALINFEEWDHSAVGPHTPEISRFNPRTDAPGYEIEWKSAPTVHYAVHYSESLTDWQSLNGASTQATTALTSLMSSSTRCRQSVLPRLCQRGGIVKAHYFTFSARAFS
jgi:hypothetical protein